MLITVNLVRLMNAGLCNIQHGLGDHRFAVSEATVRTLACGSGAKPRTYSVFETLFPLWSSRQSAEPLNLNN